MRPNMQLQLDWRPFLLHPGLPPSGIARDTLLGAKYGPTVMETMRMRLRSIGQRAGIDFRFGELERVPNTLNAHRLVRWVGETNPRAQSRLVEAIFAAAFTFGRFLGDTEVLVELGATVGLEPQRTRARLHSDEDVDEVLGEALSYANAGLGGVPFFIFGDEVACSGAQPPEVLAQALDRALRHEIRRPTTAPRQSASSCTIGVDLSGGVATS